mmetsp:Transcript_37508/g.88272  ORF Transcript_37508/g.88272 Transcript_37508/m.88272 type:complete len:244 (+) Transcript_37508:152-883(+)
MVALRLELALRAVRPALEPQLAARFLERRRRDAEALSRLLHRDAPHLIKLRRSEHQRARPSPTARTPLPPRHELERGPAGGRCGRAGTRWARATGARSDGGVVRRSSAVALGVMEVRRLPRGFGVVVQAKVFCGEVEHVLVTCGDASVRARQVILLLLAVTVARLQLLEARGHRHRAVLPAIVRVELHLAREAFLRRRKLVRRVDLVEHRVSWMLRHERSVGVPVMQACRILGRVHDQRLHRP